ncbi:hypothetical protein WJX81_000269, partial [Elliptochloris bilobata]
MYRGLVQAGVTPFAGVLGDRFNRKYIVAAGTVLWGCFAAGFGLSQTYSQVSAMAALNGVGLALVMPACQSLIADLYDPQQRGRAFGVIMTVAALGAMLGTFFATSIGASWVAGIEGWRLAFYVVAGISGATCLLTLACVVEPRVARVGDPQSANPSDEEVPPQRPPASAKLLGVAPIAGRDTAHEGDKGRLGGRVAEAFVGVGRMLGGMLCVMWRMLHIPSFSIIMVEHIIGNLQSISGYKIIYFQLLGFSDVVTGAMSACTTAGVAVGFIIGGTLGDMLSLVMPDYARPAVNQFSVVIAAPLAALLYKGMPGRAALASGIQGSQNYLAWRYSLLLFSVGSLTSWSAVNNAVILAEVVPSRERSQVYAFDRCVGGFVGALSNVIVPLIAQYGFHYSKDHNPRPEGHQTAAQKTVTAAENLLVYSGLYWTLPRDRVKAAIREAHESGIIGPRRSAPMSSGYGSGGPALDGKASARTDAGEEAD